MKEDLGLPDDDEGLQNMLARMSRFAATSDVVAMVILGHVQIESAMEDVVNAALVSPGFDFESDQMNFAMKIKLLRALGFSSEPLHQLLVELNKLRNLVAHPVAKKLPVADVREGDAREVLRIAESLIIGGVDVGLRVRSRAFPENLRVIYQMLGVSLGLLRRAPIDQTYEENPYLVAMINSLFN